MSEEVDDESGLEDTYIDFPSGKKTYPDMSVETLEKFCKDASKAFFRDVGLISHQINSFNEFIAKGLQELFDSFENVVVEPHYDPSKRGCEWRQVTVSYGKVRLEKPTFGSGQQEDLKLLPKHARMQNMTYSSKINVDIRLQVYIYEKSDKAKTGKESHTVKKRLSDETEEFCIGSVPIMVKSNLCWLHELDKKECLFDDGGYFIVKGAEKTFIAQEQRCLTRLWVSNKPTWSVHYMHEMKRKRTFLKLEQSKTEVSSGAQIINLNFLYSEMPVWIIFVALGVASDKEILEMVDMGSCSSSVTSIILATIREADELCNGFRKADVARTYVDNRIKSTRFPPTEPFDEYIDKYLFPKIEGQRQKALFLGYMVKCLLLAYVGKRKCDSKDDFRNKRLLLASELLTKELWCHIRHAERLMRKRMQNDLNGDKDLQPMERYLDSSIITNGLIRAFSTGAWCHPYITTERCSGIVANLRRTNPLQTISDMRKTRQQSAYAGKAGDSRYPNPSYWGRLCFMSTPDGENCGLVKNLAVTAIVSLQVTEPSMDMLLSCGMDGLHSFPLAFLGDMDKVLMNGDWIGLSSDTKLFVSRFRRMRRSSQIHPQVEIKWDKHQKEVRIFTDAGRILRPLLVVENMKRIQELKGGVSSFQSLLAEAIVEFIGTEEEEDLQTAWGVRHLFTQDKKDAVEEYTHCELDQSFLLGLSCSIIPFANHNFARRVLYQSEKHSQQAIGFSTTNPNIRADTQSHQLYYPQRPLFRNMIADCLGQNDYSMGKKDGMPRPELFNGQNAIVSVNVHQGYNQEDSLVMNRASLERGMFRTELFRTYKAEVDNNETTRSVKPKEKVEFGKVQSKRGCVDSLDDDGFPYIGASLQSGDIVIGKVTESKGDHGIKLKHTEKGIVQRVVLSANDDGKTFGVVTLRQIRSPCMGDKFSSMHGQKGVVGFLDSQENFPFSSQGIVPDIVINPHAFPSRQTPGQLLEAAFGKGIARNAELTKAYATPFTTPSIDVIKDQLQRAGFSRWGSEKMVDGETGKQMESMIFMGPTFYQRLVHMSEDKVKFRNTGPVHPLTRQPVADRKRFGGVKFGEMERDCLLAHGAPANLYERLFTLSDFTQMYICQTCQRSAGVIQRPVPGGKTRGPHCRFCESSEDIVQINVPNGAKLLFQELFSMGICLKFDTEVC